MGAEKNNNIIDISLAVTNKKRIRIDGDDSRILEINTSDFGVVSRLRDLYPKLRELVGKAHELADDEELEDDEAEITKTANRFDDIDATMRGLIDEIFDSNVSEVCAPSGTMYDPFNGKFRFEYIIEVLMGLYEENIAKEYKLMEKRITKHTSKYTGK